MCVQVYAYVTSTFDFMFFLISTEFLVAQLLYKGYICWESKEVSIYAKRYINTGEEITYNNKFPLEEEKIPATVVLKIRLRHFNYLEQFAYNFLGIVTRYLNCIDLIK